MVEIIVNNTKCKILGLQDSKIIKELDFRMSYLIQGAQFAQNTYGWDGRQRLLTKNGYFPVGLLPLAKTILNNRDIPFKITDNRIRPKYGEPLVLSDTTKFKPREYQLKAIEKAIEHDSGIIKMSTGCHRIGQKILMYNGSLKAVEDIVVGDQLMGPDSSPRNVLELCRGNEQMYKIIPKKGQSFVVNENHILSLKSKNIESSEIIKDISVKDYINWNEKQKKLYKIYRAGVEFNKDNSKLYMDPYILGTLFKNNKKNIPNQFKTSTRQNRLELLAGLLDVGGSTFSSGFNYISKTKSISEDIAFIARSLGLAAYITSFRKYIADEKTYIEYFKVSITDDNSIIPTRILKLSASRKRIKNNHLLEFKIEKLGNEDYYGFRLDKDHRYLLDDFTVTHNSGKTLCLTMLFGHYNIKTVIYVIGIELLYQMKDTIENAYPGIKVGMVGDGHCDIQDITICTLWSAASAFGVKMETIDTDATIFSKKKDKLNNDNKSRIRKMVADAKMIIIDECQFCSCAAAQLIHKESVNAYHRFLFSATPYRDDNSDILIEAIGGPKFYDLPASKLIREGWLVPPKIYFLNVPIKKNLGATYQEVYSNYVINNEDRNNLIIKATRRLVENKRKVLILVTRVNHGKMLYDLLESEMRVAMLDGGDDSDTRTDVSNAMRNGDIDVIIASRIFDQGVDIVNLDALVLAGSGKSSTRALQRIGRVIRLAGPEKKDAIVVDMYDNCRYLKDHTKARLKIYYTEPEFKIIMPKESLN